MAQITHPNGDGQIEVDIVDQESFRGADLVQVQATDDGVTLSDQSGNAPWVDTEEVYNV